ncbi:MAG TPA: dienelactone hydrolase family protein [Gammaproteobacteria bacterium]|nr:dienelactone hydrolase family protein [Gammaproteobacteria bacterium]
MGETIRFERPDGKSATGYLARAADDAPGVVVIQEWWGLQGQIKGICNRFADAGYNALAPDLYDGVVVPYHDTDRAAREMQSLDFLDATDNTVRGAAQYLAPDGVRVGLTGFCLGGAVTVLGAIRIPDFSAAVCFYGIPPLEAGRPGDIRVPIQCHFAGKDDWCTPEAVDAFEAALKSAGREYELYRYPGAEHGFMNEQRDVYDEAAARQAWDRCLTFWNRHLEG